MKMNDILQEIFDWSEVWALLFPLLMLLKYRKQPHYLKPVIVYLFFAFVINLLIDVKWKFEPYMPYWFKDNNFLYNVHSVVRFAFFVPFFNRLDQPFLPRIKKIIPYLSLVFLIVNFSFESFFQKNKFSSTLLATEAGLLLFYCLQYYLYRLQEEKLVQWQTPDFWVVFGLSIYVVINFFIFLFWGSLVDRKMFDVANTLWNIHNAAFIFFCLFIAKAFQAPQK